MPRRYRFSEVARTLLAAGFVVVSQEGSHVKFRKVGRPTRTAIVPKKRKPIPIGTFRSILRQAGMTLQEFASLLEG